jgi:hypothetical protein
LCVAANTLDVQSGDAAVVQVQLVLLSARGSEHAPEGATVEREERRTAVDLCFDGRPQTVHRDRKHGEAIQLATVRSVGEERNDQEQRQKKRGPTLGAVRHGVPLAELLQSSIMPRISVATAARASIAEDATPRPQAQPTEQ